MSRVVDLWLRKDKSRTTRYGKGLRWQAVWTDGRGGELKESHRTKDAALAWLKEHDKGTAVVERVTVAEYALRWESRQIHQRKGSRTQIGSRIRRNIIPELGDKLMHQVTRADVQDAVTAWHERHGLAPGTVQVGYKYLAGIFSEAVLDKVVPSTPCVKIRLPEKQLELIRPLTVDQVQVLAQDMWEAYRAPVVFAAATGLRAGEWRGLTVDRVDFDAGKVTVDRQHVHGKTDPVFGPPKTPSSYRTISVGEATLEILQPLSESPGPSGLLFHSNGSAMNRSMVSSAWRGVREKHEWAGPGWHQLRHHHASVLLSEGASVVAVAKRLGHKDASETIRTYAHLMPEDDGRLVALSDGLVRLDRHETATDLLDTA